MNTTPRYIEDVEATTAAKLREEDVEATRRSKGQCIACGASSPDGPTDSNGDLWCAACRDAAVDG